MNVPGFDPYKEWLDIDVLDNGTNHYELLGVRLFEIDPEKIAAAADRQMEIVRKHQTGPRSSYTQKLLSEIAQAKACLLNPAKRIQYDRSLIDSAGPVSTTRQKNSKKLALFTGLLLLVITICIVAVNGLPLLNRQTEANSVTDQKINKPPNDDKNLDLDNFVQQRSDGSIVLSPITAIIASENVELKTENGNPVLTNWTSANDSAKWEFKLNQLQRTYFRGSIQYSCQEDAKVRIICENVSKTITLPKSSASRTEEFIVRFTSLRPKSLTLDLVDSHNSKLKIGGIVLTPR
jgi:hypothetical protein